MAWEGAVSSDAVGSWMGIAPAGILSVPASLGKSDFSFQNWCGRKEENCVCRRRKSHLKVSMSDPDLSTRNMANSCREER